MAKGRESTEDIRGCKVHLRRGGAGEPLLFLHGAGGLSGWLPFLDALSDSFDVLAPDHPTFGLSDEPEWLDDMNDMAYFYLDFLEAMDLDGVHLVGQSLGGWIALEAAVRSTARLASLTLVSAAGIHVKGVSKADIFMMDHEELTRTLLVDETLIQQRLAQQLTTEQEDLQIKNRVSTARLGWQPRLFNPGLRKWLHRIDVPTHIVWGDSDKVIPPVYADEFERLIADSKKTVIAGAGHLPQIEKAGPFVEAVTSFIAASA